MKTNSLPWIALAVFLLAGLCCSREAPPPAPQVVEGALPNSKIQPGPTASTPTTDNIAASRKIVHNGWVTLGCEDLIVAARRATQLIRELDGYVASSRSTLGDEDPLNESQGQVVLTLRVPSSSFDTSFERLKTIGRVVEERTSTQDITDEYVDLDARLRTQQALAGQLLDLLKQAKTVKDALEVHGQAAAVQAEIEKLEGRKKLLDSQLSLSTIELQITHQAHTTRRWQVGSAITRAGTDFVNVSGLIAVYGIRLLGLLVPVLLMIGLPVLALVRLITALHRRRARARTGGT